MSSDYLARTRQSATTFLTRWQGVEATIRELTVSLHVLLIVLYRAPAELTSKNLCIYVPDPLWMMGPFAWSDAALTVEVVQARETEASSLVSRPT